MNNNHNNKYPTSLTYIVLLKRGCSPSRPVVDRVRTNIYQETIIAVITKARKHHIFVVDMVRSANPNHPITLTLKST
jgi:hypothetical protein